MAIKEHLKIMIDLLEYYVTKEIEHNVYGTGDICYVALYDRLAKCIHARKEIDYKPYSSVEDLLVSHAYAGDFIEDFMNRVHYCKSDRFKDLKIISAEEHLILIIDILESYLMKRIERSLYCPEDRYYMAYYKRLIQCLDARKEIDYIPYESVSMLLKSHGYDEEFIEKFLSKVNAHKNNCEN